MMLDAKATFDELVRRQAPDEESRDRVLDNRIYQQISNALAGSQEYMAMEKLFESDTEGRFDLLVLDTPPTSQRARLPRRAPPPDPVHRGPLAAGLHAPDRARRRRSPGAAPRWRSRCCKRIIGFDLLDDLAEFFNAFSGMVDGFHERAKRVNELLADPETCFLVVCGPQGEPIDEAVYFHRKLVEAELPFGGVIVNKVHYAERAARTTAMTSTVELARGTLGDEDLAERVAANFADYQALAERDRRNIERLAARAAHPGGDPRPLPRRGRPRPRRPGGDQPLPVRQRRRGAGEPGRRAARASQAC